MDKDIIVKVRRLNTTLIQHVLNKHENDEISKVCKKFTTYHISNLIRLQVPEINEDFKDDLPSDLVWPGTRSKPNEKPKPRTKQKKNLLLEEAQECIGDEVVETKRRSRYSGTYNDDQVLLKANLKIEKKECQPKRKIRKDSETSILSSRSHESIKLSQNSVDSACKPALQPQREPQPPKKRIRTLSSSSSSSEDPEPCQPEITQQPKKLVSVQNATPLNSNISKTITAKQHSKDPGATQSKMVKKPVKPEVKPVVKAYKPPPVIEAPKVIMNLGNIGLLIGV